ncbi:TlpA family protein disulfide reductase [Paractinoplanes durhamensis]|uniref:TlpA family protein disulfide reductase n=1 Tax=Paractinoplanes durhamensis TaxID=113563 RepID=UPI0019418FC7|nr:hypothetical protein [Actinoplanes durhamensis]
MANSLTVFSLLGVVLLMFVVAALLRDVRALQHAMANVLPPRRRQVSAFASPAAAPRDALVLVVSTHCPACQARASALVQLASGAAERVVLLSADAGAAAWVDGSPVEAIIDPILLGELGVDATPQLLRYGPDGTERLRRAVGSDEDLRRLFEAGPNKQTVSAETV